jgi:nicotinic acetylcholine receptor
MYNAVYFKTKEDWKYIALVIDRFFLYVYIVLCIGGTAALIFQAPMLFDNREALRK